jgi:GTP-binding protein
MPAPIMTQNAFETARPLVAIVGRPNVGKSTLFNRLTGRRTALVSDMPGLTRDRREGEAMLDHHAVTLVDTAGLEEGAPGSISARMREQSEAAIKTADLILFVIDSRDGVTASDEVFARVARSSGKPVILVANKSEGRAGRDGFYEAFQLGLGDPVPISAEHGEGLGDLVTEAMAALGLEPAKRETVKRRRREEQAEPPAEAEAAEVEAGDADPASRRPIRVAIVGRPNAGKSTLVNALLGEDRMITGPEPGLTRDSIASDQVFNGRPFLIFDTAGLRRKAKITDLAEKLAASDAVRAIRFAEVVVLLIDAERPLEHQELTIAQMVTDEGRALVIALNKWDLVPAKERPAWQKALREQLTERLSQVPGVPLVLLSALSGRGVDKLMPAVVNAYDVWNKRVSTSRLNRWLQEATSRHAPPAARGRGIKLRFMTQPSTRPPTFVAFCSQPEDLPKSYLRYLTNSLRDAFDMPGTPIRFNLRKGENPYEK